ncbi:MAG TPA: oligosaccharide flippase family protein, partial [Patescibacteria group bacterium]|nr:oligosaccharide flippase family protein [Patescibacteria group bacterium]
LFYATLAQYATTAVMSYILLPRRPSLSFHFLKLRELVGYSKWVYGQTTLDLLIGQADKFFVGRWLDPSQLGLYSKAKDLSSTVTSIVTSAIKKIGLPAYSRIQDQLTKVQIGFCRSVDVLFMSSLPAALLFLFEGGAIVSIAFGPHWYSITIPLKIFAFGNLFLAFTRILNPVFGALGRPDLNFKITTLQAVLLVPCFYAGFYLGGIAGLAVGVVVTWILLLVYVMIRARPVLRIPKQILLPSFWSGLAASVAAFGADVVLRYLTHRSSDWLPAMMRIIMVGGIYYVFLFSISARFKQGPWLTLKSAFIELIAARQKKLV